MRKHIALLLTAAACLTALAGYGVKPAAATADLKGRPFADALRHRPAVFVVGDDYEILVVCRKKGLIAVRVGGKIYRPENCGALETGTDYAKIRVPQSALDDAGKYTVLFRKTIFRASYRSKLGGTRELEFEFCPVRKTNGLRVYHFADIHGNFDLAKRCLSDFGDPDLIFCNGDMVDQCDRASSYHKICKFLGEVAEGRIPIVFTRGNHETRGAASARYGDFFPCENGNCYFRFSVGNVNGLVIDCGEDKPDAHEEYGGVNDFEAYRRRETEFLKGVSFPDDGKWRIVLSHVCPSATTLEPGNVFDIERGVYGEWIKELERLKIDCMFCGHLHGYYVFDSESEYNLLPHAYPVFTASMLRRGDDRTFGGAAVILNENDMTVAYTDDGGKVWGKYRLVKGDPRVIGL